MANARLNKTLLAKMAKRLKRPLTHVRVRISQRATRWDMTSEAAQVRWAKELGISTAGAFQALAPHLQQQVREHGPAPRSAATRPAREVIAARSPRNPEDGIRDAINALLSDEELKERCADTLKGRRKYDRAVNQATLVLEDRLRSLGAVKEKLVGVALAAKVLHPKNASLRISDENEVQEGMYFICAGLVPVFRNLTHHHLTDKISRQDAVSVCGFIDTMLRILAQGKRVQPATTSPAAASLG